MAPPGAPIRIGHTLALSLPLIVTRRQSRPAEQPAQFLHAEQSLISNKKSRPAAHESLDTGIVYTGRDLPLTTTLMVMVSFTRVTSTSRVAPGGTATPFITHVSFFMWFLTFALMLLGS